MGIPKYADPELLSLEHGRFLVSLARKAVEEYLKRGERTRPPPDTPEELMLKGMSFVTLLSTLSGSLELRGCIGYLQPIEPLAENVISSAIAAATEDPRFPPVTLGELNNIVFEVTVLSIPTRIKARGHARASEVTIGRDGLVVEYRIYKGVLLPEVPVEYCWDEETFLSETCIKAGLSPDCWLSDKVSVLKFYGKTFREVKPEGEVVLRDLKAEFKEKCS